MMLNEAMQQAVNAQINNELFSMYSYLSMSAFCEHKQFRGCAYWMRLQSQEEHVHAMRLYDFLIARQGRVKLLPIAQPQFEFASLPDVFQKALEQEQQVTKQINSLYEMAFSEKAFAALVELEWFINEQVEEEKTARDIVYKFNLSKTTRPHCWISIASSAHASRQRRRPSKSKLPQRHEITENFSRTEIALSVIRRAIDAYLIAASTATLPFTVPKPPKSRTNL